MLDSLILTNHACARARERLDLDGLSRGQIAQILREAAAQGRLVAWRKGSAVLSVEIGGRPVELVVSSEEPRRIITVLGPEIAEDNRRKRRPARR